MEAAASDDMTFAGASDGGCIWPDFLPAYDAAVTLVKLLDLLAAVDRPLSRVSASLPSVHVAHDDRGTPWERRRARSCGRSSKPSAPARSSLSTGSRSSTTAGWALVLPDPEEQRDAIEPLLDDLRDRVLQRLRRCAGVGRNNRDRRRRDARILRDGQAVSSRARPPA